MFGSISGTEIVLILALGLLLFGPRRLPQIGRTVGRAMAEFRKVTHEFKSSLEHEVEVEEMREVQQEIRGVGEEARNTVDEISRVARGSVTAPDPAVTTTPASDPGPPTGDGERTERT